MGVPLRNVSAIKGWKETLFWSLGGPFLEGPTWPSVYRAPDSGGCEGVLRKVGIHKEGGEEERSRGASVPGRFSRGMAV